MAFQDLGFRMCSPNRMVDLLFNAMAAEASYGTKGAGLKKDPWIATLRLGFAGSRAAINFRDREKERERERESERESEREREREKERGEEQRK